MSEKQYVIFVLDNQEYGVPIRYVKEISEYKESNKVPNTPSFVEGIINYRGDVTPIISLRDKFRLPSKAPDAHTRIIIFNLENKQVGFLVDEASQVRNISDDRIDSATGMLENIEKEFIHGIAKEEEGMIILLDLEKVLDGDEKKKVIDIK